jgi:hypothetical protein
MAFSRYATLLNTLGWRDFSIRMLRGAGYRIFRRNPHRLLAFGMPQYSFGLPRGYDLKLRYITSSEAGRLTDPQIAIPASVVADRYSQGARMYGVFWEDRVIDYCWCAGAPGFLEATKGFDIALDNNQVYVFDYKGIIQGRPTAFSGFRLMKALSHYIMNQEARRLKTDPQFFSLVSEQNRISLAFHKRYLKAKTSYRVTHYRLLGKCWCRKEKRC